jgi:flavodoxin
MKTLVVYFSMKGHTHKAAQAIASELNSSDVTLAELAFQGKMMAFSMEKDAIAAGDLSHFEFDRTILDLSQYDRIFFGTPTYGGAPAWAFDAFVKNCKNGSGKKWVLFATYGMSAKNLFNLMRPEVEKTGGTVEGQCLISSIFGVSQKKVRAFAQPFSR